MPDDLEIYARQGLGTRMGFGEQPALLIIDFSNGFNDPESLGGGNIQAAIDHTETLLGAARHHGIPVAFTTHCYAGDGSEDGVFNLKISGLAEKLTRDTEATEVVDQLAPRPGEKVIEKQYPSGFFQTDLSGWLAMRRVDTAIVAGCTTSGCVRATVVDAMGHGFRPIVPRECVGDRAQAPHEANLFDMEQKYADVMSLDEVLEELDKLNPGQKPAE
ncbi:MAG: isochorismatase family protein [Alphaproteobacteria bacterium]|nr:isochorismatase family protein [Alphaproteobacteria bacterium]